MHRPSGPGSSGVGGEALAIQDRRDLALCSSLHDEHPVEPAHDLHLLRRSWPQDHAVGLEALLFAATELALWRALLVEQLPTEPVAGGTALAIAQADQAALAGKHLDGQLATVLARHRAFDALDDRRADAAVVLKLLRTVVDTDARLSADELIVGALIRVLEPTPAADVIDQDRAELGGAASHVGEQLLQGLPSVQGQPAPPRVLVGLDDLESAARRVLGDGFGLVLGRIPLMLRRHAHILRRADRRGC